MVEATNLAELCGLPVLDWDRVETASRLNSRDHRRRRPSSTPVGRRDYRNGCASRTVDRERT